MVRFSFMFFFLIQEVVQLRLILTVAETGHELPILLRFSLSPENPENTGTQCHTGLFCSSFGDGASLCSSGLSWTRRDLSLGQRAGSHYSWHMCLSVVCMFVYVCLCVCCVVCKIAEPWLVILSLPFFFHSTGSYYDAIPGLDFTEPTYLHLTRVPGLLVWATRPHSMSNFFVWFWEMHNF